MVASSVESLVSLAKKVKELIKKISESDLGNRCENVKNMESEIKGKEQDILDLVKDSFRPYVKFLTTPDDLIRRVFRTLTQDALRTFNLEMIMGGFLQTFSEKMTEIEEKEPKLEKRLKQVRAALEVLQND